VAGAAGAALLKDGSRCLHLFGGGGMGKSWLAASEASALLAAAQLPGGAHWADLRQRADRASCVGAIALALGCRMPGCVEQEACEAALVKALSARRQAGRLLLVLDGCDAALERDPRAFLRLLKKLATCGPHLRLLLTSRLQLSEEARQHSAGLGPVQEMRVGPLSLRSATDLLVAGFPSDTKEMLLPSDGVLSRHFAKEAAQLCGRAPAALGPVFHAIRASAPSQRGAAVASALHALRVARGVRFEGSGDDSGCVACTFVNPWERVFELFSPSSYYGDAEAAEQARLAAEAETQLVRGEGLPVGGGLRAFEFTNVLKASASLAVAALPSEAQIAAVALSVFPASFDAHAAAAVLRGVGLAAGAAEAAAAAAEEGEEGGEEGPEEGQAGEADAAAMPLLSLLSSRGLLWHDARTGRYSLPPALRAAAPELPVGGRMVLEQAADAFVLHCCDYLERAECDAAAGQTEAAAHALRMEWHNVAQASGVWAEEASAGHPQVLDCVLACRAALARLTALPPPGYKAPEAAVPPSRAASEAVVQVEARPVTPQLTPEEIAEEQEATLARLRAYAESCIEDGNLAAAAAAYRELLQSQQAAGGGFNEALAETRARLAGVLSLQGRAEEALAELEKVLALQALCWGPADARLADTRLLLCAARRALATRAGRTPEGNEHCKRAASDARAALRLLAEEKGPGHPATATAHAALGGAYAAGGDVEAGLDQLHLSLRIRQAALGSEALETGNSHASLGAMQMQMGRLEDAAASFRAALRAFEKALGAGHEETAAMRRAVAQLKEAAYIKAGADPAWKREGNGHAWSRWDSTL